MKRKEEKYLNDLAYNKALIEISIEDAESGKKGYYCIGCQAEMVANKGKIKKHHFSHVPENVHQPTRECFFSSETYRHEQTIQLFNRLKTIKVPALYKFSPNHENSTPNKIQSSMFIEASHTKTEVWVYENENGILKTDKESEFGNEEILNKKSTDSTKHLLVKPDVIFFNNNNEPILFVEVKESHAVDFEKLAKFRRIGVDVVQYHIPKRSIGDVEDDILSSSKNVEWIYNEREERTEYVYPSGQLGVADSEIVDRQREIFQRVRDVRCVLAEIGNLIRGIEKCYRSERYRSIKNGLREELNRVQRNKEEFKTRLGSKEKKYRGEIDRKLEPEFSKQEREFQKSREELAEGKAIFKNGLRIEKEQYDESFESKRREIKERRSDLEERYKREKERLIRITESEGTDFTSLGDCEESKLRIRADKKRELENRANIPNTVAELEETERESFIERKRELAIKRIELEEQIRTEEERFDRESDRIKKEESDRVKGLRAELVRSSKGGVVANGFKHSKGFIAIRQARRVFDGWEEAENFEKHCRQLFEIHRNLLQKK